MHLVTSTSTTATAASVSQSVSQFKLRELWPIFSHSNTIRCSHNPSTHACINRVCWLQCPVCPLHPQLCGQREVLLLNLYNLNSVLHRNPLVVMTYRKKTHSKKKIIYSVNFTHFPGCFGKFNVYVFKGLLGVCPEKWHVMGEECYAVYSAVQILV